MDGEVAGPDYTAVPNGVPSPAAPRRTGMSSTLPLGRASGEPSEPRRTQEGTMDGGPSPTERGGAETGVGVSGTMRTDDGQSAGLAVDNTAPGANVRANVSTSEGAPQMPAASPTVAQPEGQCTTQQSAPTSTPRERLRPPLQQAVQQLSQQRTAVIQAVQSRAQRAIQGTRMDEGAGTYVDEDFQSMAGSPQATPFQEGDHGGGAWSVTRISEVLHRRLVAPVLEHVGAAGNQPGPSSSSARRSSTSTTAPDSLMSHETSWTARPTALTTPVAQAPQRDDVSDRSIQQEVVMEEVRRQVQMAMQGRDVELQELRSRNQELQKALDTSARLLNDIVQTGGGGPERVPREDWQGPRDTESRGVPAGRGPGFNEPAGAPPGLVGPSWLPDGNLRGPGRQEPSLDDLLRRASGHEAQARGNPGQGGGGERPVFQPGLLGEGPVQMANERREETDLSPLDVLVQGMKQLQQVYLDKKSPDAEALKGSVELPELPDLLGDTGVEFSDWLYVAEHIIGSLSDSANSWFAATLAVAKEAYKKHQQATPLERLTINPVIPVELTAARWSRLERRVMTMLLSSMPKTVKEDAVTHRVGTVAGILFRLHVLYAPGGVAERAHILKQLEGAAVGDNITEVIASLRRWRRNLTRALEMGVSPPDASVLLKGIEVIIGGVLK